MRLECILILIFLVNNLPHTNKSISRLSNKTPVPQGSPKFTIRGPRDHSIEKYRPNRPYVSENKPVSRDFIIFEKGVEIQIHASLKRRAEMIPL